MIRLLRIRGVSMEVNFSLNPAIEDTDGIPAENFQVEIHYINARRFTDLRKVLREFSDETVLLTEVENALRRCLETNN